MFHPEDGDVVRDVINSCIPVAGRGTNFDPVEAETVWVDEDTMTTLDTKRGVRPIVIAQFPGEAIMLPAGAPRQVLLCQLYALR